MDMMIPPEPASCKPNTCDLASLMSLMKMERPLS